MKTALKIVVVLFILGGIGLVVFLKFGQDTGEGAMRSFFDGVSKESIAEIQQRFHPKLVKECDPQILAAFLKAIPARFGAFKSISLNGFKFSKMTRNGKPYEEYEGICVFEVDEVHLQLTFYEYKLLHISVKEPLDVANELLAEACTVPEYTDPYAEKGRVFWRAALSGKVSEAFAMMAPILQKELGRQTFEKQLASMKGHGALLAVELIGPKTIPGEKNILIMRHRCTFDKGGLNAHCKYVFAGLNCHLIGFQIPSKE